MWSSAGALESTGSQRFSHSLLDQLFENPLSPDKGAQYAKQLHLDLWTFTPYVSGPNSVKVASPLNELESQDIKVNKAYLVSCTNSRASDLAAAAKVFKEAAEKNDGQIPKIADGLKFYVAAASTPEQQTAEEAGDWQALVAAGARPLPAGCGPCIGLDWSSRARRSWDQGDKSQFQGRMGSTDAKAYLASPEVVAASALQGKNRGPGWYETPEDWNGVVRGEGDGIRDEDRMITVEEALEKVIGQLDAMVETAERSFASEQTPSPECSTLTEVYPGFAERISGEIVFCDADDINTDGIYRGKRACQTATPNFPPLRGKATFSPPGIIYNFGCGSSREQVVTAILAKQIPLVVSGSFGNIFSRNSINNALMGPEVPHLITRLRESFGTSSSNQSDTVEKPLPLRTGWTLTWDVWRSQIEVQEGDDSPKWTQKVGELPPNVQEIIAQGGLEKWVKNAISSQ
jgi:homoaconitate hydratase